MNGSKLYIWHIIWLNVLTNGVSIPLFVCHSAVTHALGDMQVTSHVRGSRRDGHSMLLGLLVGMWLVACRGQSKSVRGPAVRGYVRTFNSGL